MKKIFLFFSKEQPPFICVRQLIFKLPHSILAKYYIVVQGFFVNIL